MDRAVQIIFLTVFCAARHVAAQVSYDQPVFHKTAAPQHAGGAPVRILSASAANHAVNPNNPLKNAATERLNSITQDLADAMRVNPFFQLAGISMQIRQLAITNPDVLKQAGVYVVPAPKTQSETKKISDTLASKALEEIIQGKNSPADYVALLGKVKVQAKEEQAAKSEYEEMMDPSNQSSLENTLPPQERLKFDQQRIAQIKNQISVYKKKIEKAKKAIRKEAEEREQ